MKRIVVNQFESENVDSDDEIDSDKIIQDLFNIQMEVTRKMGILPFTLTRSISDGRASIKAGNYVGILSGDIVILEIYPKKSLGSIGMEDVLFMSLVGKTGEGFGYTPSQSIFPMRILQKRMGYQQNRCFPSHLSNLLRY